MAQALLPVRLSNAAEANGHVQSTIALAIGPEGGWTDEEIASARANGFLDASLGENILRTETAVIASLAVLRFALRTH
jgi:16S rRNA (uracil1498-N3)-methyltransferase